MKKLILLCSVLFYTNSAWSADADKKSEFSFDIASDHLWKASFEFATGHGSDSIGFDYESPSFFILTFDKIATHYGVFFDLKSIIVKNAIIRGDNFKDSHNGALDFGLAFRNYIREDLMFYEKIGASFLIMDPDLATKNKNWGIVFALGFEFLWNAPQSPWLFLALKKDSFFTEVNYLYNTNRADRIIGSPMLFNHIFVGFGMRGYI